MFFMVLCAITQNQRCHFSVSVLFAAVAFPNVFVWHVFWRFSIPQTHVMLTHLILVGGFTGHVEILRFQVAARR